MLSRIKAVFLYFQSIKEVILEPMEEYDNHKYQWGSERKSLATNFDDLSSTPRIHMVEEDNQLL